MNITQQERDAVYKTIFSRRDVRNEFSSDPIPDEVLKRILTAAHHAPSVGFMQPWDFIVVKGQQIREKIKAGFEQAHSESSAMFEDDSYFAEGSNFADGSNKAEGSDFTDGSNNTKAAQYKQLKLEGILESPLGICVTCDRNRNGPVVIGKTINKEMDLYSSVCAIQNLWLAARAENLGIGWVSIIHNDLIRETLNIPQNIDIVAYLCVGYVSQFNDKPDLEKSGWLPRRDLGSAVHYEQWNPETV